MLPEGGELPDRTPVAESEAPEAGTGESEEELSDSSRTRTSIPSAHSPSDKKRKRNPEEEDSGSSKPSDPKVDVPPTSVDPPLDLFNVAQGVSS